MKRTILLWVVAVVITLISAIYQRMTGPTYPLRGEIKLDERVINYKLNRSHSGETDAVVKIETNDESIQGILYWKRFKTDDDFTLVVMKNENGVLTAELPKQPAAGKLEYFIELKGMKIPTDQNVVIRFKGDVPANALIPHMIAMFAAMLLSTRTGLEIFRNGKDNLLKLTYWTLGFLIIGGFIFGPFVQFYAFGQWWTGFPFGTDLTDNKTLIALIAWLITLFMYKRTTRPKVWALASAIVMMIVFSIPHSVAGSEFDYNELEKQKVVEIKPITLKESCYEKDFINS